MTTKKRTSKTGEKIRKLVADGLSIAEAARTVGVTYRAAYEHANPNYKPKPPKTDKKIRLCRKCGQDAYPNFIYCPSCHSSMCAHRGVWAEEAGLPGNFEVV